MDFHHKMFFRFEKIYSLERKQLNSKPRRLQLELIDLIAEYSMYIDQDPMCLFYCLFFCIRFKNKFMVDFFRKIIAKIPQIKKIDSLLEYIDTYGLEKLRDSSEQINTFIYHMVFYQAVDDDLRVVYASIFHSLKFIQLRDKDAI